MDYKKPLNEWKVSELVDFLYLCRLRQTGRKGTSIVAPAEKCDEAVREYLIKPQIEEGRDMPDSREVNLELYKRSETALSDEDFFQ